MLRKQKLKEDLGEIAGKIIEKEAYELVDIEIKPYPGHKLLVRFLVDKPEGGINIEECAGLNRRLGDELDRTDIISDSFILEVSSPGLDRPLKSLKDYQRALDKIIALTAEYEPGKWDKFTGRLIKADEKKVSLDMEGNIRKFELDKIKKAQLKID